MSYVSEVLESVRLKNPAQDEFQQAVKEVLESLELVIESNPAYRANAILERIVEPDRQIMFRVPWIDDSGRVQVNRGFRVQFNNAIGPYKGGIRLHPSVNLGIINFWASSRYSKTALRDCPSAAEKADRILIPRANRTTRYSASAKAL